LTPSMTGPSPKSYCNHIPGSVTLKRHGFDAVSF
jgi:heat shock protein HslJ